MSVRSVIVRLEAEVAGYIAGMGRAASATDKVGKANQQMGPLTKKASEEAAAASQKQASAAEQVGQAAAVAGAATVAGVGLAIKTYADFDKQMSSVQASTHETAGNMDALRQAAVDAGADTAFSAVEAAQGIEELAKAGVTTKDILSGGLDGALDLAAAGALEVGTAAEIAASAMTQFKLKGDQIPHLADLLAAGAGKAQGSVEDLGAALNQSGLVASSTGATIEETTGALAAFASAGLTGSDAGTSFKTMLMSLNPNSEAAAKLMDELGISAYDANGEFIGMSEYAGVLQNALKGMSDEQRNATLKTLFGTDAVRAANVMYEQGAEGIQKWEDAVNDAGYAAETAAMMQDNLAGDLEKLGGAFDTVLLQSGSGANGVLRELVQGTESFVDALGQVPAPILSAGLVVTALLGGSLLLAGGLGTALIKLRDTRAAYQDLVPAGSRANAVVSRTGAIAKGAASGFAVLAAGLTLAEPALSKINAPIGETADALKSFSGEAGQGAINADTLNKSFQDLVQHKDGVSDFQAAIEGIADPGLWGNIDNIAVGIIKTVTFGMADVTSTTEKARERFKAMGEELASVDPDKAADAFQSMALKTDGSQESLLRLLELMPAYRDKLEEQAKAAGTATDDQSLLNMALHDMPDDTSAADAHAEALEEVGVRADGAAIDLEKFVEALLAAGLSTMSVREATAAHQEAIDGTADAVKNATKAIEDQLVAEGMGVEAARVLADEQIKLGGALNKTKTDFDLGTEAGRILNAQFQTVAKTGMAEVEAKAKAGVGQPELQKNLSTTYQSLLTALAGMGITGAGAETLARKVLGVPDKVDINSWMSSEAKRMAEQTDAAVDNVDGRVATVTVNTYKNFYETTLQKVIRQFSTEPDKAPVGAGTVLAPRRAAGGDLDMAPGPKGVDSQLFFGAKGEHVLTAREVDLMGGQEAVYRFRAQVRAGNVQGLAGGGAVGTPVASRQIMVHPAPVNPATGGPMELVGRLQLNADATWATFRGVARQEATGAIAAADAQSQYTRRG